MCPSVWQSVDCAVFVQNIFGFWWQAIVILIRCRNCDLAAHTTLQVSLSDTIFPSCKKGCREPVLGVWEAHWLRAICVSKDFRMGTFWCQSARAQRSVSLLSPVNRQHLSFYLSVLSLLFFCLVFAATPQSFWFWR